MQNEKKFNNSCAMEISIACIKETIMNYSFFTY